MERQKADRNAHVNSADAKGVALTGARSAGVTSTGSSSERVYVNGVGSEVTPQVIRHTVEGLLAQKEPQKEHSAEDSFASLRQAHLVLIEALDVLDQGDTR